MRPSTRRAAFARITATATLALAATAAFAAPAQASTPHSSGVVFVQTDNLAGNTIVAYNRAGNGALTQAGTYATGGLGGQLSGSVADHTASQGSLVLDRASGLLYSTNPGSNTITVFAVHGDRLTRLQVISSGGSFPVSVTVHGNLVYVLNARDGGTVQGYLRIGAVLVKIPAWQRSLGLDTTLTPEFTTTPGQIAFTPDGRQLIVTTKANGNDVDVFRINALGGPGATPTVSLEDGTVPFAISFDAQGHVLVAEAGINALATYTLSNTGTLTPTDVALTGQAATCWVTTDGRGHFYASNAGSGSISGYTDTGAGLLQPLGNTMTDPGTVDASVTSDGRYLYVQTGVNGIVDGFAIAVDGTLTPTGTYTVPGAIGGEGIVTN